jgi:hypothetical protein
MELISFFRDVELYFLFYIKLGRTYVRNTNIPTIIVMKRYMWMLEE